MPSNFKNSTVKIDNEEKMAGLALFTDDLPAKDFLWCRPLRSNIACGRIRSINIPKLPKGYYFSSQPKARRPWVVRKSKTRLVK